MFSCLARRAFKKPQATSHQPQGMDAFFVNRKTHQSNPHDLAKCKFLFFISHTDVPYLVACG